MKLKYVLFAVYGIVIAFLLASVIHSGYLYQFDQDELFHVNIAFLLQHGLVPYRDIFFIYTPLFQWFLTPISIFTGFTFQFFTAARGAMIVLFIIRLILAFYIVRKFFGSRAACIFIPLYLFDPFTVFTGMQIRPDNFMMTLYIGTIFLIVSWYFNKKSYALPLAGFFLSVSSLTLLKNIPATLFIILFICIELGKNRNRRGIAKFMLALIIPVVCIAIWAMYKGIFSSMLQQTAFDALFGNNHLRFPENILNYYWPPNSVLYGFPGRPVTWAYELCLPFIAFAGMFTALLNLHTFGSKRRLVGWFTAACLVQWVSLLFVRSVFLQYFLPVSWFLAVFASYALSSMYEKIRTTKIYGPIAVGIGILLLVGGLGVSWKANNNRALLSYGAQIASFEAQWRIIPDTAVVFPGTLFRLSIYPIGYGWHYADFSPTVIERYGSPSVYLARYRIPYVVIDPYNFSFLDTQTQAYIKAQYQQNPLDETMWTLRN